MFSFVLFFAEKGGLGEGECIGVRLLSYPPPVEMDTQLRTRYVMVVHSFIHDIVLFSSFVRVFLFVDDIFVFSFLAQQLQQWGSSNFLLVLLLILLDCS